MPKLHMFWQPLVAFYVRPRENLAVRRAILEHSVSLPSHSVGDVRSCKTFWCSLVKVHHVPEMIKVVGWADTEARSSFSTFESHMAERLNVPTLHHTICLKTPVKVDIHDLNFCVFVGGNLWCITLWCRMHRSVVYSFDEGCLCRADQDICVNLVSR